MKVLIVDDHVLFREGLKILLGSEPDMEICGLAGTVQEAVALSGQLQPDLILMDYDLPDGSGAEATRLILSQQPGCKILFLAGCDDDPALFSAIRSGAKGFLLKDLPLKKLIAAMRSVFHGEAALSRSMTLRVMRALAQTKPFRPMQGQNGGLTRREIDVLRLAATGMSNDEISAQLVLSTNTVKYHLHSIYDKLSVPDRRSAVQYARQNNLIL
jgi:two-component system NarL family response regulator